MKNYLYTTLVLLSMISVSYGQQLAQSTFTEQAKHYWNPAVTGIDNQLSTSLFFRQQWVGFGASAPRTGFLSVQYPFTDMNMAAGAIINFDQTGPVSKKGLQFTYAYKLKELIGENSVLSLGINAGFQQYVFDPSDEIFVNSGDILLQGGSSSALYPVVSGGLYYLSSTNEYKENVFFFGLAVRNAITTNVLINDSNQLREKHIHFNIGTRIYQQNSLIEPSFTVNYSAPDIVDLRVGMRYELEDSFWGGLGYSTTNEVTFQGGVILPEFGNRYGALRIGALGNIGVSSGLSDFGPGFELFVGYGYDLK